MSTGPLCELFHTLVIFSGVLADIHTLALRQADQAGTDCAAIESELEVIQKQLARLRTRPELAGTALVIIFATMMLRALSLPLILQSPGCAASGLLVTGIYVPQEQGDRPSVLVVNRQLQSPLVRDRGDGMSAQPALIPLRRKARIWALV
jgi:hypothetical protein